MVARIACLALVSGFLVGCYDIPHPECGFACGPAGACPSDYSCNAAVNRCELTGSTPSCAAALDAGMDTNPDSMDDVTPPFVLSMLPADGAFGVPTTTVITATFSEPVFGVSPLTMTVDRGGISIAGTASYDALTRTATFQPFSPLMTGRVHTVTFLAGITDLAGNPLAAAPFWQFSTVTDMTPPTVTMRTPAVDATGVSVGTNVFVEFSEPVLSVSNVTVTLRDGVTPVPAAVTYSINPPVATLVPMTQLAANTTYTVNVGSAITDNVGNPLATVTWVFTTGVDALSPNVVTRTPIPASAGVPVTTTVTASFDESVINVSTTSFTLTPVAGSPIAATVAYTSATRTATLTPTAQLTANTSYTVNLTAAVTDAATNPLSPTSWSFTTGADMTAPTVVTQTPIPAAIDVPVATTVTATFDEPVLNVSTTSVTLTPMGGSPIAATVGYAAATRTATLTPSVQLAANTQYAVDLTSAITDAAANSLTPVTWTFTTGGDLDAPRVVARMPAPASAGVSVVANVMAAFDEDVLNVSSTSFTLTPQGGSPLGASVGYASATRTATLTPDLQLTANTQYTATLTAAITDAAANALSSVSWMFTTGADLIGPRVVQTTPADMATAVLTTSTIVVRFDEPVQNVTSASFTVNGGAITGTFSPSAGATIVTFTPDVALPTSATITVNLTTAIADGIANPLVAPVTFSFMTGP